METTHYGICKACKKEAELNYMGYCTNCFNGN